MCTICFYIKLIIMGPIPCIHNYSFYIPHALLLMGSYGKWLMQVLTPMSSLNIILSINASTNVSHALFIKLLKNEIGYVKKYIQIYKN